MPLFTSSEAASAGVLLDVCSKLPTGQQVVSVPAPGAATPFACPHRCKDWKTCRFTQAALKPVARAQQASISSAALRQDTGLAADLGDFRASTSDARARSLKDYTSELLVARADTPAGDVPLQLDWQQVSRRQRTVGLN